MELTNDASTVPLDKPVEVNPEFKKIHFTREVEYKAFTLEKAEALLTSQGFQKQEGQTQQFQSADVHHWTNPHTTQRANLSHKSRDKRGRPLDEAKIAYHLVKEMRSKRRTPDQKYRDNFVLYD